MKTYLFETDRSSLVIQDATRDWCKWPYPDYPNGCPRYGKDDLCPPGAPHLDAFFDLLRPVAFLVAAFDLEAHRMRMLQRHPKMSVRNANNSRRWQNSVEALLRVGVASLVEVRGYTAWTLKPEAMGLNCFRTMHNLGLKLTRNPQDVVHKIAMLGFKPEVAAPVAPHG